MQEMSALRNNPSEGIRTGQKEMLSQDRVTTETSTRAKRCPAAGMALHRSPHTGKVARFCTSTVTSQ